MTRNKTYKCDYWLEQIEEGSYLVEANNLIEANKKAIETMEKEIVSKEDIHLLREFNVYEWIR